MLNCDFGTEFGATGETRSAQTDPIEWEKKGEREREWVNVSERERERKKYLWMYDITYARMVEKNREKDAKLWMKVYGVYKCCEMKLMERKKKKEKS